MDLTLVECILHHMGVTLRKRFRVWSKTKKIAAIIVCESVAYQYGNVGEKQQTKNNLKQLHQKYIFHRQENAYKGQNWSGQSFIHLCVSIHAVYVVPLKSRKEQGDLWITTMVVGNNWLTMSTWHWLTVHAIWFCTTKYIYPDKAWRGHYSSATHTKYLYPDKAWRGHYSSATHTKYIYPDKAWRGHYSSAAHTKYIYPDKAWRGHYSSATHTKYIFLWQSMAWPLQQCYTH